MYCYTIKCTYELYDVWLLPINFSVTNEHNKKEKLYKMKVKNSCAFLQSYFECLIQCLIQSKSLTTQYKKSLENVWLHQTNYDNVFKKKKMIFNKNVKPLNLSVKKILLCFFAFDHFQKQQIDVNKSLSVIKQFFWHLRKFCFFCDYCEILYRW